MIPPASYNAGVKQVLNQGIHVHGKQPRKRRRPQQARAIKKYNEILDASARVLENLGFQQATMSEIHLESGHPYATIYQYFSNKEDVYLAWLERFMDEAIFELAHRVAKTPGTDLTQRIELGVHYSLQQIITHRHTLEKLLNGMSLVTSRMVEHLEDKSRRLIQQAFARQLQASPDDALFEQLLTATRAGNGYWLMLMLNTRHDIHLERETRNVTSLIRALLAN
ncbi:MAG: hypothetical protein CMK83_17810 [Pseudomonadales bacterium]|nr:hypothetical protein [Pseudomonadales bacterium]RLT89356.1 MAG: TetR/AcrR family transcriptional regulator [Ketobacter sp. GenoA1]RLT95798.1 MAG: TetR/AcrR family transcriptional regulator [Ketobacter sp.]TNC87826.1 MAG: hypothetical protein CSH49_14135 [Alcanivorax sp.]HBO94537.1 hypothetical protein [Gammaproteobacteria bacterium]